jgi:hypothetical protein
MAAEMVMQTHPSAGIARQVWVVRCKTASHRSAAALEPTLVQNNRWFHHLLTDGINVEYRTSEGDARGDKAWLVDSANPARNDVLAVSQFTVKCRNSRDKLKDLSDEQADIGKAYWHLRTDQIVPENAGNFCEFEPDQAKGVWLNR